MKAAIREILSEGNQLSSKRVAGMLCVITSCCVDVGLAIKFGANSVVENITMTLIISGISLLGVSKVAESLANRNDKGNQQSNQDN